MGFVCSAFLQKQAATSYCSVACMTLGGGMQLWNGTAGFNDVCVFTPQHNMPFWRISSHSDLLALHQALEFEYL